MELSKTQKSILTDILDWYREQPNQFLTLGGYAGTGKTTILGYCSNSIHKEKDRVKIAFCSFTGKAARVLKRKLDDVKSVKKDDYIGTIHRLIYKAIVDESDNIIGWEKIPKEDFKYDLVIIDEASMVTEDIWRDLLSYDIPILAVGDHGQLPPINSTFNLMGNPNLKLEEIYRQERDNPIIKLSEIARKYGSLPFETFSNTVKKVHREDSDANEIIDDVFDSISRDTMILCGYNRTRINLNKAIRSKHFESPLPTVGDRVICLKNNRNCDVYNGMTGTILDISEMGIDGYKYYDTEIDLDYEEFPFFGKISIDQFNNQEFLDKRVPDLNYFDFGYALTVHKAQGSQASRVLLFEERFSKMSDDDFRRWLYTAVTRAEKELYIIA